jgi:hypothetical protein
MEDLAERLQDIIYGFTTDSESEWETIVGFKKGRFITVGTGTPVQPTGTGSEAAIDIYGKTVGDDEKVELFVIDADAHEIQLTDKGNRLPNNEWFKVTNKDGDGYVEVFKVDADDRVRIPGVVPVGAQLLWPTTTARMDGFFARDRRYHALPMQTFCGHRNDIRSRGRKHNV